MISRFFVDRPIFATVISVVIVIVGLIAYFTLPVTQYPEVTPPTIVVRASYPGANPEVIAETVATPLEQEINGVENMLYMSSSSTSDGQMQLTITFELGTDIDEAQVLVENRVALAGPRLPEEVRRIGVTVRKSSPDMLLVVHLFSPDNSYDQLYISNYVIIRVYDVLTRLDGVGNVIVFGAREYSMRAWLDPEKLYSLDMTASDVVQALREQNVQVAAGVIGQPPVPQGNAYQLSIRTLGRLTEEEQFGDVVVKTSDDGRITRVSDVARIELGARDYGVNSYLDGKQAQAIGIFQLPGSNAIATADSVRETMAELSKEFPPGLEYRIVYDPTIFVEESINEVFHTLFIAFILVFIVVILFLQDWRAALLPMIDAIVSLIGTFAVMAAFGFSLNNLSLFGLVLAIGIVVDDAIVVVENIKRWMSKGLAPREATLKAMGEITGPVIAITVVLSAVFIPTAFLSGISGQFYRQFALTIAVSTIISAVNALTMAPARAVQLIKPDSEWEMQEPLPRIGIALIFGFLANSFLTPPLASLLGLLVPAYGTGEGAGQSSGVAALWALRLALFAAGGIAGWFLSPLVNRLLKRLFGRFNRFFERTTNTYGRSVARLLRVSVVAVLVYCGLIGLTYLGFTRAPTGFIPAQDQGYLIVDVKLPDGASLERTDAVIQRATKTILETPGIRFAVAFAGFSGATFSNSSDSGVIFTGLDPFEERAEQGPSAEEIIGSLSQRLSEIQEARIIVIPPPPVRGLGTAGGFKMQVQDRTDAGLVALEAATNELVAAANQQPGLTRVFSPFSTRTPQLYAEVDRTKAKKLNVPLTNIFDTLQIYLGSLYVNDFNLFGRIYRVTAQAEDSFRAQPEDINRLKTRSSSGAMVPLGSLIDVRRVSGPDRVVRYNLFPSAEIIGDTAPGFSSGQAIDAMEKLARKVLPTGMGFEWTDLAYQQTTAGNSAIFFFPLCVLFVFLILSSLYESWSLPLAIILIVPMCLLSAITGVWLRGADNNILTQIGFVVLVGLACKNAILIVQFAKDRQEEGKNRFEAAVEACRIRLRPILMTSFAFILGVVPLLVATGAGAEMRQALGTSVFSGMLGVTFFGLLLTPIFYVVIRWFVERKADKRAPIKKLDTLKSIFIIPLLVSLFSLTSCMVGPDYREPETKLPQSFVDQDERNYSQDEIDILWWQNFNDETLNRLIKIALDGNYDLQIAYARVLQARALRSEITYELFPIVTSDASYTRERLSESLLPVFTIDGDSETPTPEIDRDSDLFDVGFDATWELDFFGRIRRALEATTAEIQSQIASLQDVMVTLLGEVARNYFELRGAQNQLDVARRNAENQKQTLDLTIALLEGGRGTELDTSRARAQLNLTLSNIPSLEARISRTIHRLSVLTGQLPEALLTDLSKPYPLPDMQELVQLGTPEQLLRRRPDIRVAERNLAASTALIGVATADLFPRVTLFGSIALQADTFSGLFEGGSGSFFFMPTVFWAAFDIGRVLARIEASDARSKAALAQYQLTVLTAIEELENALVDYKQELVRLGFLKESADASEKAMRLARLRYQFGVTDFLTILDAERTLLEAQDRLAQSETLAATSLIAIYKALGGGWQIEKENE